MNTSRDSKQLEIAELRRHAWDYFQYHASQRTTIFNFYLVVCALLTTGYLHVVATSAICGLGILLGLLFPLLSFVFWKLDQRNAKMVRIAEKALSALENRFAPKGDEGLFATVRVFSVEAKWTDEAKKNRGCCLWKNHYEHRECFAVIFACNAALGVVAALYALDLLCSR
jgi:hypothetical protein